MGQVVVGTAGHIDHGKSSLVRALTGTDPDRLPEEKRRQITIDLGYAFLDDVAAIIDVPGHEKFIHNMVAGAATVDYALLVIASDDGIMPQTREHLQILSLLGVSTGLIVLTKIGKTEPEWRELVKEQIRSEVRETFLAKAPIFEVDSLSGSGIAELRKYLVLNLPRLHVSRNSDVLRIPIDRVFKVHGHGTVVTGTVLSGSVEKEQKVELFPGAHPARVKQLQSNAQERTLIRPGVRAALNLSIETQPERGQTITQPGALTSAKRLAVRFEQISYAPQLKDRSRIRFLVGTQEVMGRFRLIGTDEKFQYGIVLLDNEVVVTWSDRFILRRYSPLETLGGGMVLDLNPPLRSSRNRETACSELKMLAEANLERAVVAWLRIRAQFGAQLRSVCQLFSLSESTFRDKFLNSELGVLSYASFVFLEQSFLNWKSTLIAQLSRLHTDRQSAHGFTASQLATSVPLLPPQLLDFTLADLMRSKKVILELGNYRIQGASHAVDERLAELIDTIVSRLANEGFAPSSSAVLAEQLNRPKSEIEKGLVAAYRSQRAMRLGTDLFFEQTVFQKAIEMVRRVLTSRGSVQVSEMSKELNSSRKYVVPFLEYLDSIGVTERRGNDRIPGRNFETGN